MSVSPSDLAATPHSNRPDRDTAPSSDSGGAMPGDPAHGWNDPTLPVQQRVSLLLDAMTIHDKISIVHSPMGIAHDGTKPASAIGGAGFNAGVPRLAIPPLDETDASLGVANPRDARPGAPATALPSSVALAAGFDPAAARATGAVVGREARAAGFGALLAGGCNLTREPRCGRTFEYLGEDALLAGTLVGESISGIQDEGVIATIKHFAVNAQETGRMVVSSTLSTTHGRESDLLAFELGIERGAPHAVMSAYNAYNGEHCDQSEYLLTTVLRNDWGYSGLVMSDWGGTHAAAASALAGLDRQSGEHLDPEVYFGEPLLEAIESGAVPIARLDQMVSRILSAMISVGLLDPDRPQVEVDWRAHASIAHDAAAAGAVLLRNNGILPLAASLHRVVVVDDRHDAAMLSGGGSSQVTPPRSSRDDVDPAMVYHPSSLGSALADALPEVEVEVVAAADGTQRAVDAEVVIVVARQWMTEGRDVATLSLPDGQDELIRAVASVNPATVVLLQTGGPVLMPWLDQVAAVVEGWFPGAQGGPALAAVLTGAVDAAGRLPITFPRGEFQLPRPTLTNSPTASTPQATRDDEPFDVDYDREGADVGYRWYAREGLEPLFWFGFGLSYTTFAYTDLRVEIVDGGARASLEVANTGGRRGIATPQLYVQIPGRTARLAGWAKAELEAGAAGRLQMQVEERVFSTWDPTARWKRAESVRFFAGPHAGDHRLTADL